jgi:uncharacterized phage protein (TIGR01671 family)
MFIGDSEMNDRFKFRVWDKVFNHYWTDEEIKENAAWLLFPDNDNINDVEIEQCTGLRDNNGKLVFEGDVVFVNGEKWRVIWSDEDCAFFFSNLKEVYHQPIFPDFYMMTIDFEVIGNVHKNPELLK